MCQQPLNGGFYYKSKIPKTERPLSKIKQTKIFERRAERQILWSVRYSYLHSLRSATFNLWHFLTLLLVFSRLSLLLLVPVSAFGVLSTFWKVTVTTIPEQMLMYSKEANNRKQEIDRQHHTIPNQRANDKHHGNVYNLLFRYGKVRSQNMEKLKSSFPTFCKRTFPQLHKIASYAHYAQCRLLRKPSHFIIYSRK